MAPKKSSKRSESTRNGAASMKLKKLTGRRSKSLKATIRRLVVLGINQARELKRVKKLLRKIQCTLMAGMESNPRSLLSQAESSGKRRLQLYFVDELPDELFTAHIVYVNGTEPKLPVRVGLLDENNDVIYEGKLPSFKLEVFVVDGDLKGEEIEDLTVAELETSSVRARRRKGSLLVGSCVRTMENGVCCFDDLKFLDNSSWVPSSMFRLVVKVAENVQVPDKVEIWPAVSGPFRVKDQRVEPHKKHPIPSWDDEVRRLKKIGKESHGRLKAAGILNVKHFLQKYHVDQSSLRKILGVKNGVWETIVEHATKCSANGEHFRYDSEEGVELLFDCFYKLIAVSFDHQNHRSLETLPEPEKCHVEQLRQRAFEDQTQLIQINNFPAGWPSANVNPWVALHQSQQNPVVPPHQDEPMQDTEVLLRCPSFPQSPLLVDAEILYHQPEESAAQSIAVMKDISLILRSNTMLRDSLVLDQENHPLSSLNFDVTANYMFHGQTSTCRPLSSEACRRWSRARVALIKRIRLNKIRMVTCSY